MEKVHIAFIKKANMTFYTIAGFLRMQSLNGSKAAPWLISLYRVKGSESFCTCVKSISVILNIPQVQKAGNKSTKTLFKVAA